MKRVWLVLGILAALVAGGMGYLGVVLVILVATGAIYLIWEIPRINEQRKR